MVLYKSINFKPEPRSKVFKSNKTKINSDWTDHDMYVHFTSTSLVGAQAMMKTGFVRTQAHVVIMAE